MINLEIHTLEMVKRIPNHMEYLALRNNLEKARWSYRKRETYIMHRYVGLCEKGIKIEIMYYKYTDNEIVLRINPQTVLGMDGKAMLFKIEKEAFEQFISRLKNTLSEYQIDLTDFRLTRIDFTRDIQFEKEEVVDCIIKLVRKTGAPYRHRMTRYGGKEYENSYDITGECHSVVVYNKGKQYAEMEGEEKAISMKGVMRIEVRTAVEKVICQEGKLDFSTIVGMEEYAEFVIKKVFKDGFYIKLGKVKRILQDECEKRTTGRRERKRIEKILALVERIALHRSLRECVRGRNACFGYETIQGIQNELVKRRINIVTISARDNVQIIPDIKHLLGLKSNGEMQKDYEFLIKNNLEDKLPKYNLR